MIKPNSVTVIISTYNNPKWLEKTIWGYMFQTRIPNEVIIADDGSSSETAKLIDNYKNKVAFTLKHVWHEDRGFRKCLILNKAIKLVESQYVIFADQDCVPRADFVENHCGLARKSKFISGGVVKLSMELSNAVSKENISNGNIFNLSYIKSLGYKISLKSSKLTKNVTFARFMNFITPANASWNGGNSSGWLSDILTVNGYNNEMNYGGEDRELGERLMNSGLKGIQARYSVIALHLDHSRPYKNAEVIKKNEAIRRNTRRLKIIKTPNGIAQV